MFVFPSDHWHRMSEEIILFIFKWLPKPVLVRCARVCKRWNRLAYVYSPQIHKLIFFGPMIFIIFMTVKILDTQKVPSFLCEIYSFDGNVISQACQPCFLHAICLFGFNYIFTASVTIKQINHMNHVSDHITVSARYPILKTTMHVMMILQCLNYL